MIKPTGMRTRNRRAWQVLLSGAFAFAFAVRMFPMTTAHAADEPLPALLPSASDPAIVQTLGGGPFRIPAEITSARMSPDGAEIFATHENEARISILDAKTGLSKMEIPLHSQGFDLSPDGHLLVGIRESYEKQRLKRPFGVWKWPERTALWTRDDLGMPGASRFSPDGKMLAVLGSIPGARSGNCALMFDTATGRELWRVNMPEAENHFARGLVWLKNERLMATVSKTDNGGVQIFQASDGRPVEVDSEILRNTDGKERLAVALHAPLVAIYDDLHFEVVKWTGDDPIESILSGSVEDGYNPGLYFQSVDISPDGRFLFVATLSACSIYDLEKRELLRKLPQGSSGGFFSTDGETVVTALHSGIALLAANTWGQRLPATPPAHLHSIDQILFSPDGRLLASRDGEQILLWDWRMGKVTARIPQPNPKRDFKDMVFHPKDTLLVAGDGAEVFWWDFAHVPGGTSGLPADAAEPAHKRMMHLADPPGQLLEHHLCFDAAGKKLLITTNRFANLVELGADPREKGERIRQLTLGSLDQFEYIRDIVLRSEGQRISIATDQQLRSFELENEKKGGEWKMSAYGRDGKVSAFSPDGRWFAMNARIQGDEIAILDTETGTVEISFPVTGGDDVPTRRMADWKAWSGDGFRLACSAYNGQQRWSGFYVWDMKSGRSLGIQSTNRGRIRAITLAPDGRHLAAANVDGSIEIWDLEKAFRK